MQASLVMMLALSGLGCHNKTRGFDDPIDAMRQHGEIVAMPSDQRADDSIDGYGIPFATTRYPEIPSLPYAPYSQPESGSWHAAIGSTIYSFFCGHDPDVSTAREIEASVYGPDFAR